MTYRDEIRNLDGLATPAPWDSEGELYGVRVNSTFMPLGFAPHRPLDSRLIAVYRSAAMRLIDVMDAAERLAARAIEDARAPAAIGIRQILDMLDASREEGIPLRTRLAELDLKTTPPPWDPGHLVLGMELDVQVRRSLRIAPPNPGDTELIAMARSAVPLALEVLALIEEDIGMHGRADGSLSSEGALAVVDAVRAFDRHSTDLGRGTGTV